MVKEGKPAVGAALLHIVLLLLPLPAGGGSGTGSTLPTLSSNAQSTQMQSLVVQRLVESGSTPHRHEDMGAHGARHHAVEHEAAGELALTSAPAYEGVAHHQHATSCAFTLTYCAFASSSDGEPAP
jgi:hypothetical protein